MKEAKLIKELTKFVAQNNFSKYMKSYNLSSEFGDLSLTAIFDTNQMKLVDPSTESTLINELSDFIVNNEYSDYIKTFNINNLLGETKFRIVFNGHLFYTEKTLEDKSAIESTPEEEIETTSSEPAPQEPEVSVEPENVEEPVVEEETTSEAEIAYSASASAIDEANENYIAKDKDLEDAGIDPKKYYVENDTKQITLKTSDGTKTLYKEREFTSDETTYISAYLKGECTGREAAELLGYGLTKFNSIVASYKRAKNIKLGKKDLLKKINETKPKQNYTESKLNNGGRSSFDYSTIDMDKVYKDVYIHKDSVSAIAKDYKCSQSTLNRKLREYAKKNNLPLEFPSHSGGRPKTTTTNEVNVNEVKVEEVVNVKPEEIKVEIPKQIQIKDTHTLQEKESIEAYNRSIATRGSKVSLPDGWQKLEDGSLHLIKNGVVLR